MTNERRSNADYLQEVWDSLEPAWDKSKFDMKQGYDSEYECDCITITSKDNEGVRAKIYVNDYEGRHPVGFDVVYRYPGDKGVGVMGSYEFQSTDMDGLGEEVFDYFDEIKNKVGESMTNERRSNADYLQEIWDSLEGVWDKSKYNMDKGYDDEYGCECITISLRDNEDVRAKIYVEDHEGQHPTGFEVVYRYPGDKGVGVMGSYEFQSTDMDGLGEEVFDYFDEIKNKVGESMTNEKLFTLYDIHGNYPNFGKPSCWRDPQFWKDYEDYYSLAYPDVGIKITMKDDDSVDVTSNGEFIMNYSWKNGRHHATGADGSGFKHPGFGFRDDLSMLYRGTKGKEMGPYVPVYLDDAEQADESKQNEGKNEDGDNADVYTIDLTRISSDGNEDGIDDMQAAQTFYSEEEAIQTAKDLADSYKDDEGVVQVVVMAGEYETPSGDIYGEPFDIFTASSSDSKTTAEYRGNAGYSKVDGLDYYAKDSASEALTTEGKNEVSNFSRDSLGVSFDGKFGNMRKGESWVVYPETLDKGYICIQGDTRFGYINVNKGFLVLSAPHSTPIYAALMVDINKGKAQRIPLEKEIVDQILNAVNDRTITDHSLDNVIRNADVTDDELKGEAKQMEAEGSLVELIDKVDNMFHYHNKNLNNYQYNTIDDLLEALKSKDTNKIKGAISNLDNLVHYRNKNLNNSQYYLLDELLEALQKKYMKSDEAKQCEDVQYYYDRLNPTEKEKFNGLSEQIETLVGMYDENGELSKPQQDQLKELRDAIYVFGYVARGYVSFADEVLANYGVEPLIDSKEPVFDEARQPAEYSVHSYNDTDIQHYEDGTPEEWRCQRCGGLNGGEDGEPFGNYITDSNGKVVIRLLCSGCADDACDILNATHGNVRKAIGLGESKKSEDASDPMVIYKEGGIYRTTPKSNYDARIQNAFRIQKWDGFDTPQEIIDYCKKYSRGFDPDDVLIVESKKSEADGDKDVYTIDLYRIDADGDETALDDMEASQTFYSEDDAIERANKLADSYASDDDVVFAVVMAGEREKPSGDIVGEPFDIYWASSSDKQKTADYRKKARYAAFDNKMDYYAKKSEGKDDKDKKDDKPCKGKDCKDGKQAENRGKPQEGPGAGYTVTIKDMTISDEPKISKDGDKFIVEAPVEYEADAEGYDWGSAYIMNELVGTDTGTFPYNPFKGVLTMEVKDSPDIWDVMNDKFFDDVNNPTDEEKISVLKDRFYKGATFNDFEQNYGGGYSHSKFVSEDDVCMQADWDGFTDIDFGGAADGYASGTLTIDNRFIEDIEFASDYGYNRYKLVEAIQQFVKGRGLEMDWSEDTLYDYVAPYVTSDEITDDYVKEILSDMVDSGVEFTDADGNPADLQLESIQGESKKSERAIPVSGAIKQKINDGITQCLLAIKKAGAVANPIKVTNSTDKPKLSTRDTLVYAPSYVYRESGMERNFVGVMFHVEKDGKYGQLFIGWDKKNNRPFVWAGGATFDSYDSFCNDFKRDFSECFKTAESKKSESLTLKQKELKDMARYGQAEDITTISDAEAKELKKKGIETVGISRGVYGMNGALLRDKDGNKYVITARSSNLFYFV